MATEWRNLSENDKETYKTRYEENKRRAAECQVSEQDERPVMEVEKEEVLPNVNNTIRCELNDKSPSSTKSQQLPETEEPMEASQTTATCTAKQDVSLTSDLIQRLLKGSGASSRPNRADIPSIKESPRDQSRASIEDLFFGSSSQKRGPSQQKARVAKMRTANNGPDKENGNDMACAISLERKIRSKSIQNSNATNLTRTKVDSYLDSMIDNDADDTIEDLFFGKTVRKRTVDRKYGSNSEKRTRDDSRDELNGGRTPLKSLATWMDPPPHPSKRPRVGDGNSTAATLSSSIARHFNSGNDWSSESQAPAAVSQVLSQGTAPTTTTTKKKKISLASLLSSSGIKLSNKN